MANIFFSPLNQFRFVPNEIQIGSRYNTNDPDKTLFKDHIMWWQEKRCYLQPVQHTDGLNIVCQGVSFEADNGSGSVSMAYLVDISGSVVKQIQFTELELYPIMYMGVNESSFWDGVPDGVYGIVLELLYNYGQDEYDFKYYYSEPIDLKQIHNETVWINYSNYYTKLGMPFETQNAFLANLGCRVNGSITEISFVSERAVFTDQDTNSVQLKGVGNRQYRFYIGGGGSPMPVWMIDKFNNIFTCSDIRIDKVGYVPIEGSVLERDGENVNPLYGASILLSKKDILGSYRFYTDVTEIVILDLKELSYPYLVKEVLMFDSDDNNIFWTGDTPFVVNSVPGRNEYLAFLNSRKALYNLDGLFSISSNRIIFTPDGNDNVLRSDPVTVHERGFKMELSYESSLGSPGFSTILPNVIYLTDLVSTSEYITPVNIFHTGNVVNYTAPSAGSYYALVFTASMPLSIVEVSGKQVRSITPFGNERVGYGSDNIEELNMHDLGGQLNQSMFKWAEGIRLQASIFGNRRIFIEMFTNNYAFPSFSQQPYGGVSILYLADGGMSSANIDALFNDIYSQDLAYRTANGITKFFFLTEITVSNQAGSATSASLVARNYITNTMNVTINL